MAGNRAGGLKARETQIAQIGAKAYSERMRTIGAIGGSAPTDKPKGFAANRDLARIAGARGGRISKRTSSKEVIHDN